MAATALRSFGMFFRGVEVGLFSRSVTGLHRSERTLYYRTSPSRRSAVLRQLQLYIRQITSCMILVPPSIRTPLHPGQQPIGLKSIRRQLVVHHFGDRLENAWHPFSGHGAPHLLYYATLCALFLQVSSSSCVDGQPISACDGTERREMETDQALLVLTPSV